MGITAETTRSLTRPSKLRQPCSVDWTPNLQGVKFNGTNEYGRTTLIPDFIHTGATMSYWVKSDVFSGSSAWEEMGCYTTGGGKNFYLGYYNDKAAFGVHDTYKNTTSLSAYVAIGEWHHLALVANAGTATYYLDGVARDTFTYTPDVAKNPDANFVIGAISMGPGVTAADFITGDVDEVAIFKRALLATEVSEIYNNGRPRDLTKYNPVGWWRLGDTVDGSGATVPDLGYGKNAATLVNIPLYKQATASTYSDYSIAFNGSDEYMTTGADATRADKTYSFWAKSADAVVDTRAAIFSHGAYNKGAFIFNWSTSRPLLYLGISYYRFWAANSASSDNNWHHWAVVVDESDPTSCLLYVDGVLQTASTTDTTGTVEDYDDITLGRAGTGYYFDGSLDEFAVFDGLLSSATINEIYSEGIPGKLTGHSPEHWWRMGEDDGGTGTIVTDAATPGLGAELIANGTMEADSNWNTVGSYLTQTRSDEFAHSGTYSRKVQSGAGASGLKSDTLSVTAGKTYEVSFWYYRAASGGSVLTRLQDGNSNNVDASHDISATTGSWQNLKFHTTAATTGSSSYWWIYQNGVTGSTFYIDDVTVKEVNGAPGVLVNAPTSSRSTPAEDASYNHRSIDFNGTDEYADAGTAIGDALGDNYAGSLSVSMWFKSDDTSVTYRGLFTMGAFAGDYGEVRVSISNNVLAFYLGGLPLPYSPWYRSVAFTDTGWNHVAIVYAVGSEANSKMYLNGVATGATTGTLPVAADMDFAGLKTIIGGYYSSAYTFNGHISDVALWNSELSAATVTAIYNNGVPADLSKHSPRNWWRMGEGDDTGGTSITDVGTLQTEVTTELITNGTFDSDTTGWTAGESATLSVVEYAGESRLRIANSAGANYGGAWQVVTVAVGTTYKVSVTADHSLGNGTPLEFKVGTSQGGSQYYWDQGITGDETITQYITATTTSMYILLQNSGGFSTLVYFDNVSVKQDSKGNPVVSSTPQHSQPTALKIMPTRTYVILDAADVEFVDFSEVNETSEDTLRWSVDESQTFVKFPSGSTTPSFLEGKTSYTYSEIMPILRGTDWTSPTQPE